MRVKMVFTMEMTLDELRAVQSGLVHAAKMIQGAARFCREGGDDHTAKSAERDLKAIQIAERILGNPHVEARKPFNGKNVN